MATAAETSVTTAEFTNSTITGNTEGAFGAVTVQGAVGFNHVTMTNNTSEGANDDAQVGVRSWWCRCAGDRG